MIISLCFDCQCNYVYFCFDSDVQPEYYFQYFIFQQKCVNQIFLDPVVLFCWLTPCCYFSKSLLCPCLSVTRPSATLTTARRTSSILGVGWLKILFNLWRIPVKDPHPHPLSRSGRIYQVLWTTWQKTPSTCLSGNTSRSWSCSMHHVSLKDNCALEMRYEVIFYDAA